MTMSALSFSSAPPPLSGGCRVIRLPIETEGPSLTLWANTPGTERPPQGWPALIILDGEAYFTATAEMAQRLARRPVKTRIEPMMVIGVALDHAADRHAAFRVSNPAEQPGAQAQGHRLLQRLTTEVLPLIAAIGADTTNLTLMGHSMSGLFVLEARAAAAPFARHVAISPSIWANPSVVEAQPSGSAHRDDLMVLVGGQEEMPGLTPDHLNRRMISNARRLSDRCGVRFDVLDDEDHGSTPYVSLPAVLRFASQRQQRPR